jgi:hypothetical protein
MEAAIEGCGQQPALPLYKFSEKVWVKQISERAKTKSNLVKIISYLISFKSYLVFAKCPFIFIE